MSGFPLFLFVLFEPVDTNRGSITMFIQTEGLESMTPALLIGFNVLLCLLSTLPVYTDALIHPDSVWRENI